MFGHKKALRSVAISNLRCPVNSQPLLYTCSPRTFSDGGRSSKGESTHFGAQDLMRLLKLLTWAPADMKLT